jgi:hypothetical protein
LIVIGYSLVDVGWPAVAEAAARERVGNLPGRISRSIPPPALKVLARTLKASEKKHGVERVDRERKGGGKGGRAHNIFEIIPAGSGRRMDRRRSRSGRFRRIQPGAKEFAFGGPDSPPVAAIP